MPASVRVAKPLRVMKVIGWDLRRWRAPTPGPEPRVTVLR
jgi:hypothetical protein